MLGDSRALNQEQGPSGRWTRSNCPLRLTLLAGKDCTQKSGFSSALAYGEHYTISRVVCDYGELQCEGLDSMCFSFEVNKG